MMSRKLAIWILLGVLVGGHAAAADYHWNPGWRTGTYWIMRSPHYYSRPTPDRGHLILVRAGWTYVRGEVTRFALGHGGGMVTLRFTSKDNEEWEYEENGQWVEVEIDLASRRVTAVREVVDSVDGLAGTSDVNLVRAGRPNMYVDGFGSAVPDDFFLLWPAILPSPSDPFAPWVILDGCWSSPESEPEAGDGWAYSQAAEPTPTGMRLVQWFDSSAIERPPAGRSHAWALADGAPWPSLLKPDGSMAMEVIEWGVLPPEP